MRTVFADTGYWVALLNPQDDLHAIATNLSKTLYPVHIVTSKQFEKGLQLYQQRKDKEWSHRESQTSRGKGDRVLVSGAIKK